MYTAWYMQFNFFLSPEDGQYMTKTCGSHIAHKTTTKTKNQSNMYNL
jgi:hypothetical protein